MTRARLVVAALAIGAQGCTGFSTIPLTASPAAAAQLAPIETSRQEYMSYHTALHSTVEAAEVEVGNFSPAAPTKKSKNHNNRNANKKRRPKSKVNGSTKATASANRKNGSSTSSGSNNKKKRNPRPTLQPLSALKLGSKIDGVVCGISEFGAFVKTRYQIKPKDGDSKSKQSGYALLHKSQIQDEKVEDVSQVLRVGDHIKNARVTSINYAKGEVSISLRKPRPQRRKVDEIQVGKEYDGKIANVTPYGCFVDIGCKKNALLHISRITQEKVTNVRDYVNEGDWVTVHIIGNDKESGLACSMLDKTADEYLNKRQRQQKRKAENQKAVGEASAAMEKSELAAFEEAIKELEMAFSNKK